MEYLDSAHTIYNQLEYMDCKMIMTANHCTCFVFKQFRGRPRTPSYGWREGDSWMGVVKNSQPQTCNLVLTALGIAE